MMGLGLAGRASGAAASCEVRSGGCRAGQKAAAYRTSTRRSARGVMNGLKFYSSWQHQTKQARQVALAKWDSQAPVEDAAREARVIAAAIRVHRERPSTLAHGSDYPSQWRRGHVIGKQKSHERKPGKEARPAGEPIESKDGAPLGRNRRAKS